MLYKLQTSLTLTLLEILLLFSMLHNDFKIILADHITIIVLCSPTSPNDFVDRSINTALIKAASVTFHIKDN